MILKKFIIGVFLFFLGSYTVLAQESYNRLLFDGNKNFSKKNYENSSEKFKEAAKLKKEDFAAHYNLGNSYYKRNMFEEAKSEYDTAQKSAKNSHDKMAALYNLGNAYMKTNQPEKAAEFYKQSLKWDPYNEKIRKNYEIAKLKEKQKQQQKDQKNNSGKGGGDGKNKDQNSDNKDGKNPKNGNGENQKSPDGTGDNSNSNPKKDNGNNMPKDLQDAILNRVSNKERETARRILNKDGYSMPESNEKDW